ncbi:MAG: hypothetical protein A3A02_00350 [Candidatus Buchananbacteria bacterium RIFCSPLOWO2_01_FULL_39_33]|uniref:Teneurin-like YD-shell domain-containing protein n=1 Tax=Candidatus Buchananbacteria bacterium RIFCSPLOWO2_01_FULL_39_33 TaxID=1797543 RepID=A0A1G1YKL6_9BACT|nr:MAG: hypothetical protein A3A02_00350 [Candidatus Buchananbacteria bacterium RIFCSPLOWO2_01_FULL_39_33]
MTYALLFLLNLSHITSNTNYTNGNLIKITDTSGNVFQFGYDSLSRKVSMSDPDLGVWLYGYDQNGNLISQSGGGGNLVTGDGYYREYNEFGQLIRVRNGSSVSSALLEEYVYDHSGQRIKIKRNDSANTTVYTPFKELMRVVNSTGSYDFTYVYEGNTLVARINPDGSKQYEHTDHLGSTSVITNQNGNVVENTSYTPYGEELSGGNLDVKGYTGQFDDEATGQMYYGARYYDPSTALFIQWDPMMQNVYDAQLLNHYSYSRNNPYNLKDPDGKEVVVAIKETTIFGHDVGHIAFVVRNPDAQTQSQSYSFYSDQGPDTSDLKTASYYSKAALGFYKSSYVSTSGSTAEGALPDNYYDSFVIQTTPDQERKIIDQAKEIIDNPQDYYALWRNSQDFVIQSLEAGDIDIERKGSRPIKTYAYNKEFYAAQNQEFFLTPYERINRGSSNSGGSSTGRASQAEALKRFWDGKKKK